MDEVAALGDEDQALPVGRLAGRRGEPVQRIADAIDAVRVMNGERTCITADIPAPRPPKACEGFRWIGQSWASCDGCGRPAREHEGTAVLKEGSGPFGGDMDWEVKPWAPGRRDAARRG